MLIILCYVTLCILPIESSRSIPCRTLKALERSPCPIIDHHLSLSLSSDHEESVRFKKQSKLEMMCSR
ncbi:hypothetical protein XA68_16719 [Ophiocordyceps unilateralis]|uniref:Uncharacterized protein n=1 Tax=Ophiocordyceps unilateralis TaxID=268505 RepID=A0A2A9P651_OPHUN|nr:hypothetical protein XA68_16719 [Ophiocordyceps unilateralis]